jgi:hypothetical protein
VAADQRPGIRDVDRAPEEALCAAGAVAARHAGVPALRPSPRCYQPLRGSPVGEGLMSAAGIGAATTTT